MFAHDFCRFLRPDDFIFRISQYESVSKSQSVSVKPRMCCRVLSVQNLCLKLCACNHVRASIVFGLLYLSILVICCSVNLYVFVCFFC